jgi:hypothetical protein
MRQEFVEVSTIEAAYTACPWAAEIVEVEGGFQAFESMADYDTWLRSCDQDSSTSESDEETTRPFSVTWEFMGPASQQKFDVAQAVADAMVAMESPVVTPGVVNRACEQLGDGWDADSVYSLIENCSFALENDECESA